MGGSRQVSALSAALLPAASLLFLTVTTRASEPADTWRAWVSPRLQALYDARTDTRSRVEVDVHYDCSSNAPLAALVAAGLSVNGSTHLPPLCAVEGWIPMAVLPTLSVVPGVTLVRLPSYARHLPHPSLKAATASRGTGTIDGNALTIMHADQFVAQAGGGGSGVMVGVQSAGIASLSTIQARQELPGVKVLTNAAGGANSAGADEGTMLLEEIHAVAPNATLAFCEPQTFVQYTACLQQFAGAGATVMADDLVFLDQDPLSSAGTDVQALEQFLTQNPTVALFAAAGNDNGSYWEGTYTPVSVASQGLSTLSCNGSSQVDNYVNQFSAGANQVLTITTSSAIPVPITFAWADPPGKNASNFDVFWKNASDNTRSGCLSTAAGTQAVMSQSITLYPGPNTIYIATPDASLAGKLLKLWVGGDGLTALSIPTAGSLVTPQAFAAGAITVGAVNGSDGIGNQIESFSSRGPITVAFPTPARIQAPLLVAPDGIYVDTAGTFFASMIFPDGNFYGTSAATPNAAAVAALIRGAFPDLTRSQLVAALETGAAQLGASVPDATFGYGRIDATGALATLPGPTMTALQDVAIDASSSTTSAAQPFTVTATGSLHFSIQSTNSMLVPASLGASGSPGVTISPTDCGSSTLTCSMTVTAAPYQGGTTTVTLSAVDGAGRAAPATLHVTVTNPQAAPPPPVVSTSKGGGGGGGSGALSIWDLVVTAALALLRLAGTQRSRAT